MIETKKLFDFDDVIIPPYIITDIDHRDDIDVFVNNDFDKKVLPLFTAPMFDVIDQNNIDVFKNNNIIPIIPRSKFKIEDVLKLATEDWYALSFDEFKQVFLSEPKLDKPVKMLIDIANGHMKSLYVYAKKYKEIYGDKLILMLGNIANPLTYEFAARCDIDYVRVGIGNGNACLTTQQTAIGYPMASLIKECYSIKNYNNFKTKIIADGGMKKYSDIIKAIALGADYVMVGSLLNKCLESAAETYFLNNQEKMLVNQYDEKYKDMLRDGNIFVKKYRGMSTKEIQKEIKSKSKLKTSEGVVKYQNVEYTVNQWTDNFVSYLKTAMSYTNCFNLEQFKGYDDIRLISENAFNRFSK